MATLTRGQSNNLQRQIDEARRQIENLAASSSGGQPLPQAPVSPTTSASTTANAVNSRNVPKPKPNSLRDLSIGLVYNPNITQDDINQGRLTRTGTARNPNNKAINELKAKQQSQVNAGTSAVYNPETINKTKRAIDAFGFALNDITKDPFNGKQSKLNKTESLISSTQKQLAKLFKTPEEFQNAYNTNQTFKDAIDNFQKMGGKADGVTSSIVAPVTPENAPQTQDTASYLADIKNPQANQQAQQSALDELIPERDLQQQEISRLANIPKEMQKLYWGDENEIGLMQQKKAEAEEEKRIVEREEKNAQNNLKAQAKLAIQKNQAEVQIQTAQVEENRLAAKNYMTGYLAKLGALNTTGAAGLAIQTLDTKYQIQKQTLETNAKYDNQTIELKLTEALNTIETDTDRSILKIQQDLSKTTEDVFKEVTKAQQEADKEIARISLSYAKTLREKTDDYVKKQKAEAEKYAKEYAKIASGGLDLTKLSQSIEGGDLMEGQYVPKKGVLLPNGKFASIEQTLESSRGADGYVNSAVYLQRYKDWISTGGTATTFKTKYPPVNYVNPQDNSLPPNLRYAKQSQTIPKDTDEDSKKTKGGASVPEDISKQIEAASNI